MNKNKEELSKFNSWRDEMESEGMKENVNCSLKVFLCS